MDEEEMMRAMGLPVGFGAKKQVQKTVIKKVAPEVIPMNEPNPVPKSLKRNRGELQKVMENVSLEEAKEIQESESGQAQDEDGDSDIDSDPGENLVDQLPFSSFCSMTDHLKTVTTMSLDRTSSRLITGGRDNMVKIWDFNGMKATLKPFMEIEPSEGNPVRDVHFSLTGDSFLVAPSNWQPILFDRDGMEVGHTAGLSCVRWHPFNKELFMTASLDSTVRIWSIENRQKCRSHMFAPARGPGERAGISVASFSADGKSIVAGDLKGNIRVWGSEGTQTSPRIKIENAHMAGAPISSVTFSLNGFNVVSRANDDTLKLWDIRNVKEAIGVANDLFSFHEEANAVYSPNERYILTGSDAKKGEENGYLYVFDAKTLQPVNRVKMPASCVRLMWPQKIGQVFCGLSNGEIRALYDPDFSTGGVMYPLAKANKKLAVDDYDLFMGGVESLGDNLEPPEKIDPSFMKWVPRNTTTWTRDRNLRKPDMPFSTGPGKGGTIGVNYTQEIMKGLIKNNIRNEDPREAILKFAEIAEKDPVWIAPAYQKTQKKAVLANSVYEDVAEAYRESKRTKRKQ